MNDNFQVNFSLKRYVSILIGVYFLLGSYTIKATLDDLYIDNNPTKMMAPQIIEFLIFGISFIVFIFSSFTLFFKGKIEAKKNEYKLWNSKTKNAVGKYLIGFIIIFMTLFVLRNLNFTDYITPVFLFLYGVLLFLLKNKECKNILILSGLCIFLVVMCFIIPSYWYSSLSILGIAHLTYGVASLN